MSHKSRQDIKKRLTYLKWLKLQNDFKLADYEDKTKEQMRLEKIQIKSFSVRWGRCLKASVSEASAGPLELDQSTKLQNAQAFRAERNRQKKLEAIRGVQKSRLANARKLREEHSKRLIKYRSMMLEIKSSVPPETTDD